MWCFSNSSLFWFIFGGARVVFLPTTIKNSVAQYIGIQSQSIWRSQEKPQIWSFYGSCSFWFIFGGARTVFLPATIIEYRP
jgi:hypothetical protein